MADARENRKRRMRPFRFSLTPQAGRSSKGSVLH